MTLSLYKSRNCLLALAICLLTWGNVFSQNCPNLGNLTNYLFVFTNGSTDANWQGATKGFAGNVAIDGIQATERTSGGVPFAGTIYTNDGTLGAWAGIVSQNSGQAFASTNQTSRIAGLESDLASAFSQINALSPSPGYSGVSSTSLNGLNTQNGSAETFVINITSGMSVSSQINITGDASDCFVLRWDSDGNPNNGYQGQTKFQSGGAVVPLGGLKPSNFINVAGDIASSGGGSNPPAPYPQGPRNNNGTGSLIPGASNFSGGGFFTGYWLTTGDPASGESSSMSNGIFVGGWYSSNSKFSMTSGTSGVYVAPNVPPPSVCTPPAAAPECTPPTTWDVDVTATGTVDFQSLTGVNPNNVTQKIRIRGTGTVIVNNSDLLLKSSGAVVYVEGAGLYTNNGNLKTEAAGARFLMVNGTLRTSANFQQSPNSVVCITNSTVDIGEEQIGVNFTPNLSTSADFQNDGGYRYLNTVCMNVTHDFQLQSTGSGTGLNGVDVIINSCIEIGDRGLNHATPTAFGVADGDDSGNWQNNNRQSIYGTDIVVANGSYQNSIGVMTLCDVGIKVNKSGSLQNNSGSIVGQNVCIAVEDIFENSASWSASISNWYSQKQNSTNVPGAGGEASLNTVLQCFVNCCQLTQTGSLGDCVWNDLNQNGIKDNGEPGVPNVTVQLLNCQNAVLQTAFTNASGIYNFPNLAAGCYRVCVVLPNGFSFSPQNQGGNDANDSDVATTDGKTANIDLSPGENDPTNDAGIFQPTQVGSLGDCVWNDLNQNGIKDPGEPGVPNVTVQLLNCQNGVLQTVFTSASGIYNFPNLAAGCYRVCVVLPNGFQFSPQNQGGNDANDSDVATTDGKTANIDLSPGENDPTNDAGIFQPTANPCDNITITATAGTITVTGLNGSPIAMVQVFNAAWAQVFSCQGNCTVPTQVIPNLPAGTYFVKVNLLTAAWSPICQKEIYINVPPGGQNGSLGDCIFNDLNQNGIKENGEPGVPNVPVQLKNCQDVVLQTMQTTASGNYNFANLAAGCYRICVVLPNGFQFSPQNQGGNDANDSDVNPGGCTANIDLSPGENDPTNDAGIFQATQPCSVNIVISNKICDGKGTASTADDTYTFTMTVNGTGTGATWQGGYSNAYLGVFQFGPTPYNTPINLGPFPAGQFTAGNTNPPIVLQNGVDIQISVSDTQNGSCSDNETVVSTGPCSPTGNPCDNVTITATAGTITVTGLGGSPVAMVQVFNAAWAQVFNCAGNCAVPTQVVPNLPAGTYFVKVSLLNAAWSAICQKEIFVTVPPPGNIGSVGDCVWNDTNQNGIKDPTEPGVSGIRVRLFTCAGVQLQEKFTNGSGIYNFPNVAAGSYYVGFDLLPAGFQFTGKDLGGNDATDSDANPANGQTDCFTLAPGENKTTCDAGIRQSTGQTASLGDYVWLDINANGCQEIGEMGIENVWVGLYDNAGNFLQFDITDAMGFYLFENLAPGTYKIKVPAPTGLTNSPRNACGNEAKDSDLDDVTFTAFSDAVTLVGGQNYRDLDAGFESIPSPCVTPLTATVSGATCANGQVTFSLLVTGGNPWGWNIANGGQFIMGTYGVSKTVTLPISGNSLSVIISDSDNPTCVTTATINCSGPPPTGTDLELTSNASPLNPGQWANSVLTFSLKNNGTVAATGVEVQLPAMSDPAVNAVLAYVSQNVPAGTTFNNWTGKWTVGNLAAGQTLNLGYTLFTKSAGAIPVFAQVSAQSPADADSSPNNNATGTPAEDDEARTTLNPPGGVLAPGDRKDDVKPDLSKIEDFTLFPNPAGESVAIDLERWQGKSVKVLILNHLGIAVFEKQIDRQETPLLVLDLSGWKNGQYFVQLETAGQRKMVKKLAVLRMY